MAATALGIELQNWKGQSVPYKFGLVTDVGKIDDKSFNESSWNALNNVQKRYFSEIKYIVTIDPKDYAKNIATFADDGYDVIVISGYALGSASLEAAQQYPDVKFIGRGHRCRGTGGAGRGRCPSNLAGLIFDEDTVRLPGRRAGGSDDEEQRHRRGSGDRSGAAGVAIRRGLQGRRPVRQPGCGS